MRTPIVQALNGHIGLNKFVKYAGAATRGKSHVNCISGNRLLYLSASKADTDEVSFSSVSAVIEAKKLVMPLMEELVKELENQPGK